MSEPLPFKHEDFVDIVSDLIYEIDCNNSIIRVCPKVINQNYVSKQSKIKSEIVAISDLPFIVRVVPKFNDDKPCDMVVIAKIKPDGEYSNFIGDLFNKNLKDVRLCLKRSTHRIVYVKTDELKRFHEHVQKLIDSENDIKLKELLNKNVQFSHKHYEYMNKLVRKCLKLAYKKYPKNKVNIFCLFTTMAFSVGPDENIQNFNIKDLIGNTKGKQLKRNKI